MAEQVQQDADPKDQEIQTLRQRNSEYEKLLLDPGYLEYLANNQNPNAGNRGELTRGAADAAAKAGEEGIDFEKMSNKELAQYIVLTVQGMVNQQVQPLKHETKTNAVVADVKETAAKYKDFWDYKQEMIDLGRKHPTLGAEDAYFMAKGMIGKKPQSEAPREVFRLGVGQQQGKQSPRDSKPPSNRR